jgi:hypothetical protein
MDQIAEFFDMIGATLGLGGAMIVGGVILLVVSRSAQPENRRVLKWIGWPVLGCGGCLVAVPLVMISGLILLGLTVVGFCQDSASC